MAFAASNRGAENATRRVLLATEQTRFKTRLIEEVIELLLDGDTFIRIVDHSMGELDKENPEDYSVVLISNSGVGSRVRPWVTSWINSHTQADNIIVHTTWRDLGWSPRLPESVDSVTSPSNYGEVVAIAEDLASRVGEYFAADMSPVSAPPEVLDAPDAPDGRSRGRI